MDGRPIGANPFPRKPTGHATYGFSERNNLVHIPCLPQVVTCLKGLSKVDFETLMLRTSLGSRNMDLQISSIKVLEMRTLCEVRFNGWSWL